MAKIELTPMEEKVLRQIANETFRAESATDEELAAASSGIDKYTDYETEMEAWEESGAEPIKWFMEQYDKQQNG